MKSELERECNRSPKVTVHIVDGWIEVPEGRDWTPGTWGVKAQLRYKGRKLTTPFYMGPAHTEEPSAADILYCLMMDSYACDLTFDDWCQEYGYDTDSRKAHATWVDCNRMGEKVKRLLGDDWQRFDGKDH